ncbi:MAG: NAD(P)-binding domain-containing protein [Chitinivibrionales bacterium]|nr:NAD(P)-binding domain-containing protein [Chitinivibrionales bacterium]
MNVGIIGSGDVGRALGKGLLDLGYFVKIGSREPASEKIKAWLAEVGSNASSGTFEEAARFGDVAILATLWSGAENALTLAGPQNLKDKVVIDVTNPLIFSKNGPPGLALGFTDSAGEQVQRRLKDARVVKAFNTVGFSHMVNPQFPGGPPDMFICGNDAHAKKVVTLFCKAFGWGVVDMGDITAARLIEPLALVWITYGVHAKSWNHAFKLLRK